MALQAVKIISKVTDVKIFIYFLKNAVLIVYIYTYHNCGTYLAINLHSIIQTECKCYTTCEIIVIYYLFNLFTESLRQTELQHDIHKTNKRICLSQEEGASLLVNCGEMEKNMNSLITENQKLQHVLSEIETVRSKDGCNSGD